MVCILDRPTPQALFDRIRGNFEANVLGGYDVIPESLEWYVVTNDYAMAEEFYSVAEAQWKARDPRYACCSDLYDMAALRGIYPNAANFAQGYARITGDAGATIPSPIDVLISDKHYLSIGTVPATMPSTGFVDFRIKAVVPGVDGNLAVNKLTGSLATAATGIDSSVKIYGDTFCGGSEAETCEQFRSRYLDRLAFSPVANSKWIMDKILTWPCVTRVFIRDGNCCVSRGRQIGCGCADCGCNNCTQDLNFYPLFDNTFDCGIPPACVITDMNAWLFGDPVGKGLGEAPIGICGELFAPEASVIDVRISGLNCSSSAQITKVRQRIADVFLGAAPSALLTKRAIEFAIVQVIGVSDMFEVVFEDQTGNMTFNECGDLDPACDIMPCLGEIIMTGSEIGTGVC